MLTRFLLFILIAAAVAAMTPAELRAQGVITIRLSYKVVLNPADVSRPSALTDANLNTAVDAMNALYATYFRGYRFQIVEIINVGGVNDTTGPSRWYNTNFFDNTNVGGQSQGSIWKDQMEAAARSQAAYRWNNNAINLYLTNGICGGICSFASENDNIVIIGGCSAANGALQLHELGHYFNLYHTQGRPCGNCTAGQTGVCHTIPGDDEIADTLPDLACWSQNNIAQNRFGRNYAQLNAGEQNLVDDVFFNVMSYHPRLIRLTELQLDRWADTANGARAAVRDGTTIFARAGGPPGNGSSTQPVNSLTAGVNLAVARPGADIVLLRPGVYNEQLTINTPVTLRATRQGPVIIGSANPPNLAPTLAADDRRVREETERRLRETLGISRKAPGERVGFPGSGSPNQ